MERGRLIARLAADRFDLTKAQAFRARCFGLENVPEADVFDPFCSHVLIEDRQHDRLVGYYRIRLFSAGQIGKSYSAQFYGLERLRRYHGLLGEVGRFCLDADTPDPDVLRLAWAMLTDIVDRRGVHLLFGCSSFPGCDPKPHADAFRLLATRHLAPAVWRPEVKAACTVPLVAHATCAFDRSAGWAALPSLLRTYLIMGGWVSDHAVVDRKLETLHVFTAVEIAAIPAARKRRLRSLL